MFYKFSAIDPIPNINNFFYVYSFQSTYPSWELNTQGKQFLLNLRTLREQDLRGHEKQYAVSPPRMWAGSPETRASGLRNICKSRELPYKTYGVANQKGPSWVIDVDQNNISDLLDWYYTCGPHDATSSRDVPPAEPFERTRVPSTEYWRSSNITENEAGYEEYSKEYSEGRATSHLGASTSAPIFRETLLEDQNGNNLPAPNMSHWWARSRREQAEASFFEPPDFNHQTYNYHDKLSDRGSDDQEQYLDWRDTHRLSRTTHTDDLEAGEFNLHFDDVYSRPPETPTVNPSTGSF